MPDSFKDFVLDQLAGLGELRCRAMFGGHGLYLGDRFFGIIHRGRFYLKVSERTLPDFLRHGAEPFRPTDKQTLQYYEVPAEIVESALELKEWAKQACAETSGVAQKKGGSRRPRGK